MKTPRKKEPKPRVVRKKVNVGITIFDDELDEMRKVTCIDLNGPAVLSLARKGLAYEKQAALNKAQ